MAIKVMFITNLNNTTKKHLNQNKMTKEFIPYELALRLKALGFDEPCFGSWWFNPSIHKLNEEELQIIKSYYFGLPEYCILAPTFSQAFRWLREKYNLKSWIEEYTKNKYIYEIRPHKITDYKEGEIYVYATYEEAELACLEKLIELTFKSE